MVRKSPEWLRGSTEMGTRPKFGKSELVQLSVEQIVKLSFLASSNFHFASSVLREVQDSVLETFPYTVISIDRA